ncbi:LIM zinc-binding domain-containing protein [Heracleum sosnowskyi]|uniref:LIM zinc-binding domain-containing protein n=1 Tax=Heracleum sosnowskyi TaxID=360622 RepID=A0AAD8GTZ7_9APIA|nr:LIM zinc-binding domain-containing protein [Heracleum sosnowskyi]
MSSSSVNHISQPCIYAGHFVSSHAERKSRFMKWLSKLFKGSGTSRLGGERPQFLGEESMVWSAPVRSVSDRSRSEREKEELDRAIALSLAEDLKRRNAGNRWQTKSDEDLARALQNNLNSAYPPYAPSLPREYQPRTYRVCGGCNRDIGYGNYLGCMGTFFHPDCFCCHACRSPITEHEFSLSGKDAYHKSCFKELTHPKCEVCHQFIPTNGAGLIEYRCHPFWSQKYCPSHEHDNTARCCSCERLESWNARYISLGDGRSLCLECMESAVMDTGDCQPLYHAIRDYYEGMNMRLDQQIPMLLVERQALNEAIVGEKNGFHHMPETRGLCLSEEQTVASILKRPRIGGHRLVGMRTQPQKLTRRCEVTAILVLYGLPRLLTGAILAHELMHGWLRLKGYRNLNPAVEEGICQVLSYMWLESEVMPGFRNTASTSAASTSGSSSSSSSLSSKKGGRSPVENKIGEFFMHQIAHDTSTAYGEGFRAANKAVNAYGLRRTLDHIRLTGSLPV